MTTPATRRRTLQLLGGGAVTGLAGCLGGDDAEESSPAENGDDMDDETDGEGSGTDGESEGSDGLTYAFTPDTVAVIDTPDGEITAELPVQPGGRDWADVCICSETQTLFAVDSSLDQVIPVDLTARELLDPIDVGGSPAHGYLASEGEFWVHADDEGRFYVIETDTREVVAEVDAGLDGGGHGKLVHHESLAPYAYATNVNDPAVLVLDLDERERVDEIELDQVGGTHYIEYAAGSELLYVEYQGIETAVVDPDQREVIDSLDIVGGMATDPAREVLAIWERDELQFIDGTDTESGLSGSATLEGVSPTSVEFVGTNSQHAYVSGSETGSVNVLDVDGTFTEEIPLGDPLPDRAVDSGDGYYIGLATETTVAIVSAETRETIHEVAVGNPVDTIRYVPDQSRE